MASRRWYLPFHILLLSSIFCIVSIDGSEEWKKCYGVLGLDASKSHKQAVVKRAYRQLSLQYHPDKNPDGKSKFQAIQEAYGILTDTDKQATFDGRHQCTSAHKAPQVRKPSKTASQPAPRSTAKRSAAPENESDRNANKYAFYQTDRDGVHYLKWPSSCGQKDEKLAQGDAIQITPQLDKTYPEKQSVETYRWKKRGMTGMFVHAKERRKSHLSLAEMTKLMNEASTVRFNRLFQANQPECTKSKSAHAAYAGVYGDENTYDEDDDFGYDAILQEMYLRGFVHGFKNARGRL